jgi:hypothetical protein
MGGDSIEDTNQKIEEILGQIKYKDDSNIVNKQILYMITKLLQKVIDTDEMKTIIFDALKPKIQQSIDQLLGPNVFNSVDLKKNILSAVLEETTPESRNVTGKIRGGIQSYLEKCQQYKKIPTGDDLRKHLLEKFTMHDLYKPDENVIGGRIGYKHSRRIRRKSTTRKSHPKRKRVIRKTYRRK